MWAATAKNDEIGTNCNAAGPCPKGEPGGMVPIIPTAEDKATLKNVVENFVLKRWAKDVALKNVLMSGTKQLVKFQA